MLDPISWLILKVLELYSWVVIAAVVVSWLISFGVINTYNRFVYMVNDFLYRITDPALRPLRRIVPNLGGIDISPVVLILIIYFIQMVLERVYVEILH